MVLWRKSSSTESLRSYLWTIPFRISPHSMVTSKIAGHAEYVKKFFKKYFTHKNSVSVYDGKIT